LFLNLGCAPDETESPTAYKLRGLSRVYLDYAVPRNGAGPANEAALKKHIKSLPDFVLQGNWIDPANPDAVFTSERDNEPFVVIYGQGISSISGKSLQVIAHEKTGVRGKKLVTFVSGKVELVNEARLQELLNPKQS
jgi:hypothetical protein